MEKIPGTSFLKLRPNAMNSSDLFFYKSCSLRSVHPLTDSKMNDILSIEECSRCCFHP
jgi:hypothetical protein